MKLSDISVEYIQHAGSDLMVANAARVSFDKESDWEWVSREPTEKDMKENFYPEYPIERIEFAKLPDRDAKLIKYLANHKHTSPFNHSFITTRIKAPIFVARQLVKHKFMPWNEVSRRYVDEEPEFYMPKVWRARADNVKQGSGEDYKDEMWTTSAFGYVCSTVKSETQELCERALDVYQDMLRRGVAPEQARMVLPQNMMTQWYWSGTLGAYCDMLRLRLDPHTQYESRIVAEKIKEIITPLFPVSVPALLEVK